MVRFVLFDLDNTLVDRQLAYGRWARGFAAHRGLGSEAVQVLAESDEDGFAPRQAVFEAVRQACGLAESVEQLIAEYRIEYPKFFQPDHSVLSALQRLREHGFRIGVVTNGPATQREKLDRSGLNSLVDGVCISEECGIEKPDPRIFTEAIRRCGGVPNSDGIGWMVGDAPHADVAGGKATGLQTMWLSRGRTWSETDFAPDLVAPDVNEAINLIVSRSAAR